MIEVFKTNIRTVQERQRLLTKLSNMLPGCRVNFDLENGKKVPYYLKHMGRFNNKGTE